MRPGLRLRREALTELVADELRSVAGGTEPSETICWTFPPKECIRDTRICLTSPTFGAAGP